MRDLTGLVLWTLCGLIGVPAAKRKMAPFTPFPRPPGAVRVDRSPRDVLFAYQPIRPRG
jgi:hypothetical protein